MLVAVMQLVLDEAEALGLDGPSFRRFYDDALPRVYGYLLHRVGWSVPVAEDLTQETFFAAVRELKRDRRVDDPTRWVLGIARHKLLDHYRAQERADVPSAEVGDEVDARPFDTSAADARERAVTALTSLPAAQRAAVVLRHFDGFTVPEVAELMGRSVEAVESLLARGRVAFRRAYNEEVA
jgi:RNA polymerase sigma-70 factor, ECF subfamily